MQPEAPASPVSIPQLAGQLHAELIDHQTAPGSNAVGQHSAVLASVANEHDTVVSEELYHSRQRFALRFDVSRPWLLLILHGRLAFDGNGRDHTRLLDAHEQCLCLTAASHQELTILGPPVNLIRIGFPLNHQWIPAGGCFKSSLPLLPSMIRLVLQAHATGATAHTRDRLFAAFQGYCAAELAALGIQQTEEPLVDSLRRLLSWLPDHLDQPLGLADLAHAACLSPRRLQELCREQFGCRPMELLRRHRLEAMHAQLISPAHAGESLAQLMNRWQLPDSSATRQAFLELYGNSPQKLRKQLEAKMAASGWGLHA